MNVSGPIHNCLQCGEPGLSAAVFCHACGHQAYAWPDSCQCDKCKLAELLASVLRLDKLKDEFTELVNAKQKETAEKIGDYIERIDKEMNRRIETKLDEQWKAWLEKETPL